MISAKMMASSGAISDGFSTMVQPAARAGPTLQVIWFSGQFHGVIRPTTPIGSLTISALPLTWRNWNVFSTSAIFCRCASPTPTWLSSAIWRGAPISRDTASARSLERFL